MTFFSKVSIHPALLASSILASVKEHRGLIVEADPEFIVVTFRHEKDFLNFNDERDPIAVGGI